MERILIAYYSRSGNTEKVAKALADVTGGSLFRIETSQAYPADYRQLVVCAMDEEKKGIVRELKELPDLEGVQKVFILSPNWFGTIVPPVRTFASMPSLSGRQVALVLTHGGSGIAKADDDIRRCLPQGAEYLGSLAIRGDGGDAVHTILSQWIETSGQK